MSVPIILCLIVSPNLREFSDYLNGLLNPDNAMNANIDYRVMLIMFLSSHLQREYAANVSLWTEIRKGPH